MKIFALLAIGVALMATSCTKTELQREVPSSPQESYEILPE